MIVMVGLLVAALLAPNVAAGLSACTASAIVAQDSGCPVSGACTITKTFSIGDGCILDFGARDVTLGAAAVLDVGSGSITINAANLTMVAGALIDARGQETTPPGDKGGNVTIATSGNVTVQKSGATRARIDASANALGGAILINTGGSVNIAGRLLSSHLSRDGSGGAIQIFARGDITSGVGSEISATAGTLSLPGGRVEMDAGGKIDLGDVVDVSGSGGGVIDLGAMTDLTVRDLRGAGTGDTGSGGTVTLTAWRNMQILGQIMVRGSEYNVTSGEGGTVTIDVAYGDLTVGDDILAEGGSPDGDGGEIDISVESGMQILSGGSVSARSNGSIGVGGTIDISVGTTLTTAGLIDASGGGAGGEIGVDAGGDIVLGADVDVRGRYNEGFGGEVAILAGVAAAGTLTVQADVDASGGRCDIDGCGDGGLVELAGCNVTITAAGRAVARAPGVGGQISITTRSQLRVDGTVTAVKTQLSGLDGATGFSYPIGKPPILRVAGVAPDPALTAMPVCAPGSMVDCLMPCPLCGNGAVEYPETCDDGGSAGCDGCSRFCVTEVCDPAALCATACNPQIGCPPLPPTPCASSPTPTATQAPLPSATPSRTLAPGAPTLTPSLTPTQTATGTWTPTRTQTSTGTATRTPSRTPTATTTFTTSPTPATRYDAVVLPLRPITVEIKDGQPAVKVIRVRVLNGTVADGNARPIRLRVDEGDCPSGVLMGGVDFDSATVGSQDTALLTGGRMATGSFVVRADPMVFQPLNKRSPNRCTLFLDADVPSAGNADPSLDNNSVPVELNVLDQVTRDAMRHQTAVSSAVPLTVRLKVGKLDLLRKVRVMVNNADHSDVAGHAITLDASDGDCPTGTVTTPVFHKPNALPVNNIAVTNMRSRAGTVGINIRAADFQGGTRKSPRRCTALLVATGPSGDVDPSNNVTLLPIDVVTQ